MLRFSVVIPLFNKRPYIYRAVSSVLKQSYDAFELIVVDDGSTDDSLNEIASLYDPRLKVVRQSNAGEGAARNRGVSEAREEWISFLDADDFWTPQHLAETAEIIMACPRVGFVATGYCEVDESNTGDPIQIVRSNIRIVDYLFEASKQIGRVNSSNVTIRRSELLAIGGFGAFRTGGDLDCWARLGLRNRAALSDRVTSIYVRGTGGVMEQIQQKQLPGALKKAKLELKDISPSVKMICAAIEENPKLREDRGVHAYLNGRVFACVYGSLAQLDTVTASKYSMLLSRPYPIKIGLFRAALVLPAPILVSCLRLVRAIRGLLR